MICNKCGNFYEDNFIECPHCGTVAPFGQQENQYSQQPPINDMNAQYAQKINTPPAADDKPNMVINILSLLMVPILGVIMYFVEKDKHPIMAKSALKFGIGGWVISFVVSFISILFSIALGVLPMLLEEFY